MTDDEYDTLRDWLRVKWIPGNPSVDDIVRYDDYLALSDTEQSAAMNVMSDEEVELFIELEISRALYVDPVDRDRVSRNRRSRAILNGTGVASIRTRPCRILQWTSAA